MVILYTLFRLSSPLDVSQLTRYGSLSNKSVLVVNVTATDHGNPRLSDVLTLKINIIDVNEENPRFNSTLYRADLAENSPVGSFVMKMEAVKNSISSRLTYSFTANQEESFSIDQLTVRSSMQKSFSYQFCFVFFFKKTFR